MTLHVEVVDAGAPLGILTTVRADEADDSGVVFGDADERIAARLAEPLAPDFAAVAQQVTVEELLEEAASIRPPPAIGVKRCDGFGVIGSGDPVLHDILSLAASAWRRRRCSTSARARP